MKKVLLLFALLPLSLFAQRITPEEYIQTYKDIAIREMKTHKIPASITLAQGILESGAGNSALAREAKNHFGIKCHKGWEGDTYYMDDDEKNECFRKYDNVEESFRDHSEFLCGRTRYAALFELDITDYEGWAKGLKAAGYATNPKYAQLLIDRINLYDLAQYDQIALGLLTENEVEPVDPEVVEEYFELAFSPEDKSVFPLADMTPDGRFIYENNKVRFVFAKEGETPESMAQAFGIKFKKFCEYNCLKHPEEVVFHSGDVVYLDELRNRNWKAKPYTVQEGETLRDVALRFAVKPRSIQHMNGVKEGERLYKGQELRLR
ncbi:MAG: glucosaminidase domain-containing protein [Salinivirgaceae bacterium]|nr:glucosaminidase domain-containing protein [Salinivirgaceae bacterium]MBR5378757.1 glucosaminidase domain-containing protein [Bacteroidales bacterium]